MPLTAPDDHLVTNMLRSLGPLIVVSVAAPFADTAVSRLDLPLISAALPWLVGLALVFLGVSALLTGFLLLPATRSLRSIGYSLYVRMALSAMSLNLYGLLLVIIWYVTFTIPYLSSAPS